MSEQHTRQHSLRTTYHSRRVGFVKELPCTTAHFFDKEGKDGNKLVTSVSIAPLLTLCNYEPVEDELEALGYMHIGSNAHLDLSKVGGLPVTGLIKIRALLACSSASPVLLCSLLLEQRYRATLTRVRRTEALGFSDEYQYEWSLQCSSDLLGSLNVRGRSLEQMQAYLACIITIVPDETLSEAEITKRACSTAQRERDAAERQAAFTVRLEEARSQELKIQNGYLREEVLKQSNSKVECLSQDTRNSQQLLTEKLAAAETDCTTLRKRLAEQTQKSAEIEFDTIVDIMDGLISRTVLEMEAGAEEGTGKPVSSDMDIGPLKEPDAEEALEGPGVACAEDSPKPQQQIPAAQTAAAQLALENMAAAGAQTAAAQAQEALAAARAQHAEEARRQLANKHGWQLNDDGNVTVSVSSKKRLKITWSQLQNGAS